MLGKSFPTLYSQVMVISIFDAEVCFLDAIFTYILLSCVFEEELRSLIMRDTNNSNYFVAVVGSCCSVFVSLLFVLLV